MSVTQDERQTAPPINVRLDRPRRRANRASAAS